MSAPKKITKDIVLEAAFKVFRKQGFDAVNARSIAKEIKCSTQPIYVEFANILDHHTLELHPDAMSNPIWSIFPTSKSLSLCLGL